MVAVSLVIITLNEEENIERCIRSAPWVDEVIVLDSGSTDRTQEISEKLGAKFFSEEWRGYRDQKARATELANNEWVLSLDADEALSPELSEKLQSLKKSELADGYEMPRVSWNLGRWIWHGGWYPDRQLRFFNKKKCHWSEGHVHERVVGENIQRLSEPLRHWPFKNLSAQIQTNNEYSSLAAKDLYDRGKKYSLIKLFFKPLSKFLETYIIKRGFLDGWAGFVISIGAAYSMFLKWAKLREIEMSQK